MVVYREIHIESVMQFIQLWCGVEIEGSVTYIFECPKAEISSLSLIAIKKRVQLMNASSMAHLQSPQSVWFGSFSI